MSWPVGTMVVCVHAGPITERHPEQEYAAGKTPLKEGAYYTISAWTPGAEFEDGVAGVQVAEIPMPYDEWYDWWRFRKAESSHSEASAASRQETAPNVI